MQGPRSGPILEGPLVARYTDGMDTPEKRRWYRPTPGWLVCGLLVVEGLLWLSERFEWFWFNEMKGWTVLICVAVVGVVMLIMLLWFIVALVFRRQFQFSIRSLLGLTVAVAVPCSWLAVEIREAKAQQVARTTLGRFPGHVDCNEAPQAKGLTAPEWLRRALGDDFFVDVQSACMGCDEQFTDADLACVVSLRRFTWLTLYDAKITTNGLRQIASLPELDHLFLSHCQIGDDGLEQIAGLVRIEELGLDGNQITDAGLRRLEGLRNLKRLELRDTGVTDEGAKRFQQALPDCVIER